MHISTIREAVECPVCKLKQFERGLGQCRRCHHSLGITYVEVIPTNPLAPLDPLSLIAIRMEAGELIRRLRSRRGITQAALASLTGIHRTYLSRAERGQVMPSAVALLQIFSALGVDKVLLRARDLST